MPPRIARAQGYSRRHRFSAHGSFGAILKSPKKLRGSLASVHVLPAPAGTSRLGIALTRRLVRSAVDRNRVKRLVREAYRMHPVKDSALDCVVSLRLPFKGSATTAALRAEVIGHFDRLVVGRPA
jgi:ribonuclease P protein component